MFALSESLIYIQQCIFIANRAESDAGVVFTQWNGTSATWCSRVMKTSTTLESQTVSTLINSSQFVNNSASSGGVIRSIKNTLLVSESTFINNTAYSCGGVLHTSSMTSIVITGNSSFHNNKALNMGGVVYVDGTYLNISNCSFTNNRAVEAGSVLYCKGTEGVESIYIQDGRLLYSNSTLLSISTCQFLANTGGFGGRS